MTSERILPGAERADHVNVAQQPDIQNVLKKMKNVIQFCFFMDFKTLS